MNFKMKLKYKKMILGVTLGTMVLGLAVLSINTEDDLPTGGDELVAEASVSPLASPDAQSSQKPDSSSLPEMSDTPEPVLDPKALEVEKNAFPEVNEMIEKYYKSCVEADVDTVKSLVSDEEVILKEALEKRYEYVEEIRNIDCYTMAGPDEGSKVVFVYYELKLVDIDTLAPGMAQFYITPTEDADMVIILSGMDDYLTQYLKDSMQNPAIVKQLENANTKLLEAEAKDDKLKKFVDTLNESAKQVAGATATPKASEQPKASEDATKTAAPKASEEATKTAEPKASAAASN